IKTTRPIARRASQPSFRLPAIGNDSYSTCGMLWMLVMRLHFPSAPVSVLKVCVVFAADRRHGGQSTLEECDLRIVIGGFQRREPGSGAVDLGDEPLARLVFGQQVLVGPIVDVRSLHQEALGKS